MKFHQRKIQSFAKYSYAITLPVHWVKKNKLLSVKEYRELIKKEKALQESMPQKKKEISTENSYLPTNYTYVNPENINNNSNWSINKKDLYEERTIVNIYEMPDGSLQIYPYEKKKNENDTIYLIDLDELMKENPNFIRSKAIRMLLISFYVNGATGIEIISKNPIPREILTQIKQVQERLLLNWNTNRISEKKILIKNVFKESKENIFQDEIPRYLRESFSLILWIIDDIILALESGDYSHLEQISEQDDEIDRYYFFTVRQIRTIFETGQITKPLNYSHKKLIDLRLLSKVIEDVGDCLKESANILAEIHTFIDEIKLHDYIYQSFKEIHNIYKQLADYLRKNLSQHEPQVGMNKEIMSKIQEFRNIGIKLQESWEQLAPHFEFKKEYNYLYYYKAGRLIVNIENIFKKVFDFTNLFF